MDFFQPLMEQLPPDMRGWVALTLLVVLVLLAVWMY